MISAQQIPVAPLGHSVSPGFTGTSQLTSQCTGKGAVGGYADHMQNITPSEPHLAAGPPTWLGGSSTLSHGGVAAAIQRTLSPRTYTVWGVARMS